MEHPPQDLVRGRVVVAMSGGVDSSLAAALLVEQGYEVIGVTLQIWPGWLPEGVEGGCCSLAAVEDARSVANTLGIPYYVLNFQGAFEEEVINPFIRSYLAGETPNPCIECNRKIKFRALLEKAWSLRAEAVATGHYAQIGQDPVTGRHLLLRAVDAHKDQTYALYQMTQVQLTHTRFPVGGYTKTQIREMATERGFITAKKPESQEICFIPDDDYRRFLMERVPESVRPGLMLGTQGQIIGEHQGISFYTVGQRKGLGVAKGERLYVVEIDPVKNQVVVGREEDLYAPGLLAGEAHFIPFDRLDQEMSVQAAIRYNAKPVPAWIEPHGDRVRVRFERPQRAVTPGQAVVFFQDNVVVGGGVIQSRV